MPRRPRPAGRPVGVLAAGAAALVLLAGCTTAIEGTGTRLAGSGPTDFPSSGSSSSSGRSSSPSDDPSSPSGDGGDLVDAMLDDMAEVSSGFRVQGDFDESGSGSALDLQMQGQTGQGTITIDGETCQIRAVDGTGWANATEGFWSDAADVDPGVATAIANQWVELSGDVEFLTAFVDQDLFLQTVVDDDEDFTLGDTTTVDGVDAQEVDGDDETFTIATDSPHLLYAITDDDGSATVTFPDTDVVVEAPTPTIPYPG